MDVTALRAVAFGLFGLAFGSFMTVVVHRVPKGESIAAPRSACPACGAEIRAIDNVPVASYVLLRGRCHACGARISPAYPLTELATAALFVLAGLRFGSLGVGILVAALSWVLLACALIDLRHRVIPNRIVYPSLVVAAVAVVGLWALGAPVRASGALMGFLAYGGGLFVIAVISPRGMGMGDVKLAALIGLVVGALGLGAVGVAAAVGILAGGIGGVVALALGRSRKSAIPFGPYLALGGVVGALAGQQIAGWYLHLLGA